MIVTLAKKNRTLGAALLAVSAVGACHLLGDVDDLEVGPSASAPSSATSGGQGGAGATSSGQGGAGATSTGQGGGGGATTVGQGGAGGETSGPAASSATGAGGGGGASDPKPNSCEGLVDGCGPDKVDCCTSDLIVGGAFHRNQDAGLPATVSSFRLDRFEVTVARFRKFIDETSASKWKPAVGAGKHAHLDNGKGLAQELGWVGQWDTQVPSDAAAWNAVLSCPSETSSDYQTWTPSPGVNENKPVNCVSWFQAYAFCIWDGGFLPTENELNFASASVANNLYPWGTMAPTKDYAVFNCGDDACSKTSSELLPVGSKPKGNGTFKTADLAGNVAEWPLDLWQDGTSLPKTCVDCALVPIGSTLEQGVQRGGSFGSNMAAYLGNANNRFGYARTAVASAIGFRCARLP